MANLEEIKNKLNSINNGKDFRNGDGLGASTINDIINLSKDIVENVKKTGKMFLSNSETPIYGISVGGFQEPQFINPNFLSSDIQVGDKFLSVSYDADNESDKYLSIFKVTELPTELDDNIMASLQSYVKLPQGSGGNINVDSELSETSENPVQNKVVAEALSNKVGFYDFNTKEAYQNGEMVELSNVPIFLRTSKGIYLSNAPDGSGRKVLGVTFAPDSLVKSQSENLPFSTNQISLAVRAGLTKPRITWTDDEKALARENLGISGGGTQLYDCIFTLEDGLGTIFEIHQYTNINRVDEVGNIFPKDDLMPYYTSGSVVGMRGWVQSSADGMNCGTILGFFYNYEQGDPYMVCIDQYGEYTKVNIANYDLTLRACWEL